MSSDNIDGGSVLIAEIPWIESKGVWIRYIFVPIMTAAEAQANVANKTSLTK